MIDLEIRIPGVNAELLAMYQQMAQRSRHVRLRATAAGDQAAVSALLTNNPELASAALAEGRYVLLLNPFAITVADRRSFASTHRCMPALPARHLPSVAEVMVALDSDKLGEPGLLRIHRWTSATNGPAANGDEGSAADDRWLTALLYAELDLALQVFRRAPTEVYAIGDDSEGAGRRQLHLGFANLGYDAAAGMDLPTGGMAIINVDTTLPRDRDYYALSLIGFSGAAHIDDHHNLQWLLLDNDSGFDAAVKASEQHLAVAGMIDAFAYSAEDRLDFAAEWQDVENVLAVVNRAHTALEQSQAQVDAAIS